MSDPVTAPAAALEADSPSSTEAAAVYGGFDCDGMALAMPISALREVVPWKPLQALPCAAAAVRGGLDVRGTVVPVVDLGVVLGRAVSSADHAVVIVVVHEGQLFGLLADCITGMFTAARDSAVVDQGGALPGLYAGSLRRADNGALVSLLSAAVLLRLPGLPTVPDRERTGLVPVVRDEHTVLRPVLLLRCGPFGLALDALAVHATLADPVIAPSVLAQGHCLGVVAYGGRHVPAVDLGALLGLVQPRPSGSAGQAFIVRSDVGDVALIVDEVLDVTPVPDDRRVPVPALALPRAELFEGAWPLAALPKGLADRLGSQVRQFFALSMAALRAEPSLQGLAATNTDLVPGRSGQSGPGPARGAGASSAAPAQGPVVITFEVGGEYSTLIEEVAEILRFTPDLVVHPEGSALFGMLIDRGRTIPVLCLRALAGQRRGQWNPDACVLVVRSGETWLGFAVSRLRTIDRVLASHPLPSRVSSDADGFARALGAEVVDVLRDERGERTLRRLPLQRLTDELAQGQRAITHCALAA